MITEHAKQEAVFAEFLRRANAYDSLVAAVRSLVRSIDHDHPVGAQRAALIEGIELLRRLGEQP